MTVTAIVDERPMPAQAARETRFTREALVAQAFGRILHDVTTDVRDGWDFATLASNHKDLIRLAMYDLVDQLTKEDERVDIIDLMNLLHEGRL